MKDAYIAKIALEKEIGELVSKFYKDTGFLVSFADISDIRKIDFAGNISETYFKVKTSIKN